MAEVSKDLLAYWRRPDVSRDTPLKVVAYLDRQPAADVRGVPRSESDRRGAIEVLRSAGVEGTILRSPRLKPRHIARGRPSVTLELTAGELEELSEAAGIGHIRLVRMHRMHLDESVPLLGVNASVSSRFDGSGVTVAVIDSGIDHNHPDLQGRVLLDRNRNFTDEGGPADVSDGNGHGTHVAGIIGGGGAHFRGVAPGVRLIACKVFTSGGKTTEEGAIIDAVRHAVQEGADIINYSGGFAPVDPPIALIDPPWVWPQQLLEEEQEFERAMQLGSLAVVSAGNEGEFGHFGTLSMPATCAAVLSVGAIGKDRVLSGFSSWGPSYRSPQVPLFDAPQTMTPALRPSTDSFPEVDLVAPGGEVDHQGFGLGGCFYQPGIAAPMSTNLIPANEDPACVVDAGYWRISGTSQAAPHVSGLAALVLQATREAGIDLGPHRAFVLKRMLRSAAARVGDFPRRAQGRGLPVWGELDRMVQDLAAGRLLITSNGLLRRSPSAT